MATSQHVIYCSAHMKVTTPTLALTDDQLVSFVLNLFHQ